MKNPYPAVCKFCKAVIYTPSELYICPVCRKKQKTGEYIPHVRKKNVETVMKNLVPKKGTPRTIAGEPWYYAGRTLWKSKAERVRTELKTIGVSSKLTFDKYLGHFIWTSRPIKVDLAETRAYNPTYMRDFKQVEAKIGDRVYRPFKFGWGTVKDISGKKVKIKWDTGGTRWYYSYQVQSNPLGGMVATVGNAVLAGVGLGVGFGAVNYAKDKLSKKKNPTLNEKRLDRYIMLERQLDTASNRRGRTIERELSKLEFVYGITTNEVKRRREELRRSI